jgi:hypothetical protein
MARIPQTIATMALLLICSLLPDPEQHSNLDVQARAHLEADVRAGLGTLV